MIVTLLRAVLIRVDPVPRQVHGKGGTGLLSIRKVVKHTVLCDFPRTATMALYAQGRHRDKTRVSIASH